MLGALVLGPVETVAILTSERHRDNPVTARITPGAEGLGRNRSIEMHRRRPNGHREVERAGIRPHHQIAAGVYSGQHL
jgi:hypothetical protein